MAVNPVDNSVITPTSAEAEFNAAVENSEAGLSDEAFTEQMISGAITIGGQFILMPMAQNILNEAMSSEDEE
ncbi:hypothetical protein DN824_13650 [Stutzerimonas nosocomialis]|uniref:Uncharacterized protein n=1 Tax=Stutzerimonas nosocomialis TaxID=1056496 RepID=A0A5R9QEX3_9GAMM|nr:hypothetical protein [Stutzerimonas nosocomialis]TLX56896.1 hypothetical protein DN824_13650 [Stutzerimonas nosocomialis]TLX58653.1 hypothetical protein DN826_05070 [Stutzerimonas nosocomialis]TLX63674.1 hypothetical protein DN820_09825 [Stutzerimonas nosocomialis]